MSYVTINEIVKNALIDIGEQTEHLYQRFLHWSLEGLKDFSFDTAKEIKTIAIPMNATKTIDFPPDYVDWTKIGTVVGGRVWTFAVNHQMELKKEVDECGNPIAQPTHLHADAVTDLTHYGGYWFYNYHGHQTYGYGGACHNIGYYRINRERRQIQFSSEVNTQEIYLEYMTNGVNTSGESVVNAYAAKLIKLYILWMRKEHSNQFHTYEKERARTLYYNELRMVRARLSNFDVQDFIEATRKGYLTHLKHGSSATPVPSSPLPEQQDCADVFPETIPQAPADKAKKRYWGISTNPDIASSGSVSQFILGFQSEFSENRSMTKTIAATGGHYLYFSYPKSWGKGHFIFNTFPTSFLEQIVSFTDQHNVTEDCYLYRSLNLQHGNNLTVEIQ
jgi:hypothetical protein